MNNCNKSNGLDTMIRISQLLMSAIVALTVLTSTANAQDASAAAFEGHVFDAKTLRPLDNVWIQYEFTIPGGGGSTYSTLTNSNGFYQIDFQPPAQPIASVGFTAICRTRKGNVTAPGSVYDTLRTQVYRRDFYVTLPKGITKCTP